MYNYDHLNQILKEKIQNMNRQGYRTILQNGRNHVFSMQKMKKFIMLKETNEKVIN